MAKLTLNNLSSLTNEQSAVTSINTNNDAIETALENTLSRNGTLPNQMEAELDMNSNRIINLPSPVSDSEPLRLQDLTDFLGDEFTPGVRTKLTADTTYYIRSDGSNSNTGLLNTAAGAWSTIAYAMTYLRDNIDMSGFKLVVQVQDGTWTESVSLPNIVGAYTANWAQKYLVLRGNVSSLGSCKLSVTGGVGINGINSRSAWLVEGFEILTSGSGAHALQADINSLIYAGKNKYGACGGQHMQAIYGAKIEIVDDWTISGNATLHWYTDRDGQILVAPGKTCTLTSTPAFSSAFASAQGGGGISFAGTTFSGSATGPKAIWSYNGNFDTDPSTLPGSTAVVYGPMPSTLGGVGTVPVDISIGGTSSTTAKNARTNLGIQGRTTIGDANVTLTVSSGPFIQPSATYTAPRVVTLPLAAAVNAGTVLQIGTSTAVSATNTMTIQRQGSDTFTGSGTSSNAIVLPSTHMTISVESDGASNWTLVGGNFSQVPILIEFTQTVDFNAGNTDTQFPITLPAGMTKYRGNFVAIHGASGTLTTATAGMFTAAGGGGVTVVTTAAITVATASDATNNNAQQMSIVNAGTITFTAPILYFRVTTPQGSAATAKVTVAILALP